ncbi:hypothetical protein WJX81_005957 [Elliptochloris bilobata]|uniref:RING-type domain-containing protein n=1 Tax=Elliptochloris bilobata TaxID=381761 RepID=A0AAW1S4M0_9CHLO
MVHSAQAAAFVPGGSASLGASATSKEVANSGRPLSSFRVRSSKKGHADGGDGARSAGGAQSEGGISRALRSGRPCRTSNRSPGAQGTPDARRASSGSAGGGGAGGAEDGSGGLGPADGGPAARGGEAAPLGRSPQRSAFIPANHLLNFQYDSRAAGARGGVGAARGRGGRRGGPRPQPYDRNKFLQANFRFLVSDAGDLRRWEADADLMPDWEDVVEVEMLAPAPLRCPISLDAPPLCPQITPCGHVFAFPAIMAHLAAHNDGASARRAAPCPLCYSPVVARELRLVRVHQVAAPQVGDVLTFKLLRRPRRSILPVEAEPDTTAAHLQPSKAGEPSAAAAWATSANGSAGNAAHGARTSGPPVYNRFSKFTAVADATPLWRGAAEALAEYAAVVMTEGTLDAATEAPHVFAAADALAARAAAWTERRQRLRVEAAVPGGPELQDAHETGAVAAAEVKKVTTAAVSAAAEEQSREAAAAARAAEFPSLPHARRPADRPGAGGAGAATHMQAARAHALEAAFSDEDDYFDLDADLPGPASVRQAASPGAPDGAAATAAAQPSAATGAVRSSGVPIAGWTAGGTRDAAGSYHSDSEAALGSSPTEGGAGFAAGSDFHFYQAEDGQWLFLGALEVRALLMAAGGAPAALPGAVAGRLLAVEPMVQTEAARRRIRFLGHLPLNGTFHVAEIDLAALLPTDALAPFAEELRARERRRERRSQEEAKRAARDAAREAAALAAAMGPTAAELRAMPLPSAAAGPAPAGDAADAAAGAEPDGEAGDGAAAKQPTSGLSFANITKLGYAATGPALGTSPTASAASAPRAWGPAAAARPPASAAMAAPAAWGATNPKTPGTGGSRSAPGGSPADAGAWGEARNSLAEQLSAAMAAHTAAAAVDGGGDAGSGGSGKKGRRGGKQTLLFSTAQRRY